jgi:hypothetical protein
MFFEDVLLPVKYFTKDKLCFGRKPQKLGRKTLHKFAPTISAPQQKEKKECRITQLQHRTALVDPRGTPTRFTQRKSGVSAPGVYQLR